MSAPISVRVSDEERKILEARAEEFGVNVPELLRIGGRLLSGFSPWFWSRIVESAGKMNITPDFLIEAMVLDKRTDVDSEMKVSGVPQFADYIIIEGDSENDMEALRGERLYQRLLNKRMRDKERDKVERENRKAFEMEMYRRGAEAADKARSEK